MQAILSGENPIQILSHSVAVSPTTNGYTFQYSADGVNYNSWSAATPANEILVVNHLAYGMFIRLSGNTESVTITY